MVLVVEVREHCARSVVVLVLDVVVVVVVVVGSFHVHALGGDGTVDYVEFSLDHDCSSPVVDADCVEEVDDRHQCFDVFVV